MKKKFSKILGVGLTLALLFSLLLTAAPVSALTQPSVVLTEKNSLNPAYTISKDNIYTVTFTTGAKVLATEQIVVVFEAGTEITGMTEADVEIETTAGLGGVQIGPIAVDDATVTGEYPAAQTLTITPHATENIGTGAIVQLTIGDATGVCVTNPDTAGAYNLTVGTQEDADTVIEAAVTSAAYTIIVPTISGLPGVASVYNPTGVLMAQENSLVAAVAAAGPDYTIYVGPGTYAETATINITHEGLTFASTAGAATTIIDDGKLTSDVPLVIINAAEVTVDGFTIGDVRAYQAGIQILADDATVKNNIITAEPVEIGIFINADGATVTGNELDEDCTMYLCDVSDSTISDNIFGECLNLYPGATSIDGLTVTDNTMIGSAAQAIDFEAGKIFTDILIEGNTISETEGTAAIQIRNADNITDLRILGNEITDNDGDGILIQAGAWDVSNLIQFNTITGNDSDSVDYGIQNDSSVDVDATFNWWGTTVAADIADMVSGTSDVTTDPFLADTVDAVFSATKADAGTSLDASTEVGVKVEGVLTATIISVAKYAANPQAAIADAIAFFDVYVANGGAADAVTLKFYAGDENSTLHVWSADTEAWVEMGLPDYTVGFSAYGGYVYVTVMADLLGRTPFAVVAGEAEAEELGAPVISTPTSGADDVDLTPIFAWEAVTDADGYYFEFADNANFVLPLAKLDGDTGRLIVTAYAYVAELPYSTAYYWRVKAVSGTIGAGDLAESGWASAIFITMDEPVEPTPPIVVEEAPDLPDITIEQPDIIVEIPDIIVPLPAETPVTPGWIYVIIGVGAVLVIALLVLIVRTRRVA